MNEQLVVKNFGPIKEATVDFKRVTVFIGPTGGGKSTLAKLAAVWRSSEFFMTYRMRREEIFKEYGIELYFNRAAKIVWKDADGLFTVKKNLVIDSDSTKLSQAVDRVGKMIDEKSAQSSVLLELLDAYTAARKKAGENDKDPTSTLYAIQVAEKFLEFSGLTVPVYIPTERIFVSAIEYAWAGLMRDDIGLPKLILNFANRYSIARPEVKELDIAFLNTKYIHQKGQDFVRVSENKNLLHLSKTASGIQSVTPMLVLLEHLSRNTKQAQSFIIEEPELNLYPTAQQGLLNWLVEKCTKGENDLTITTHSPYLLAHFNLLLFAHQVAHNYPERAEDVAKIVPRESWIDPKEFAAYHVEGQRKTGCAPSLTPKPALSATTNWMHWPV